MPSSVGFWCAFSILCVIIVQTPAKRIRIISLEKPRKGFRPQKAFFSIPDSARPPLGTGNLRFLLACLLACLSTRPQPEIDPKYFIRHGSKMIDANREKICECLKKNLPVKGDLCEEESQLLGTALCVGHHLC